jgi:hypothetical protein
MIASPVILYSTRSQFGFSIAEGSSRQWSYFGWDSVGIWDNEVTAD